MRAVRLLASICTIVAFVAGTASAQTLYKWIDNDGRVHFSDKPPVGFKGEVTRIQPDTVPDPVAPRVPAAPPKARTLEEEKEKPLDTATRRRITRDQLAARVQQAREKLEAARKNSADGDGASDNERQFVRQNFPRDERRPDRTPPPRTNCMSQKTSDGKAIWNCPRQIPNESYFDRQAKLEDAIRKAEEELEEAERAYRRGVD